MFSYSLSAALVLLLLPAGAAVADTANLSGHWQLDPSRSSGGEETHSLDVTEDGNTVSITRHYAGEHGSDTTETFKCTIGGQECKLVDGDGHKAQVSFWYDGSNLVMLKTNGDRHDSTVEWHFQQKDDKTLQVSREVMEPSDRKENLVFNRVEVVATR